MKKIIFLVLFLPFATMAQENRIGKVSKAITAAKAVSGEFQSFEIFNSQTKNATTKYSEAVKDGVVVAIDQAKVNELLGQNPKQINLSIPFKSNGETISLDLIEVAVFSPDFKAVTNTGRDITKEVDFGRHYRGIIAGNTNSLVSISIFESQITGFIASEVGNYSIAKVLDSDINHIIYKDSDLKTTQDFNCSTVDDGQAYTEEELSPPGEMDPGDILDIYVESGERIFELSGNDITNTVVFLTGIYAQVYVLYANDGILARTSNMMIWTTEDPYTGNGTAANLGIFQSRTENGDLDADLGSVIDAPGNGGIAAGFSGICASNIDEGLSYSGLFNIGYANVPTYSWHVNLLAHEIGHTMGSRHTHACVWNGDGTSIDGCAGFTEGGCPLLGNPPGGGTIMSYCHNTSVGVNFNLGFGPQPTAVILNNINTNGNCLNPSDDPIAPTAVCKTFVVTLDANGEASITVDDVEGGSYDDDGIISMSIDINTFDCDDVGEVGVTLTVTDTDGLIGTCIAYVQVIDGGDPEISCPEDLTVIVPIGTLYELPDYQNDITITTATCNVNPAATNQSPSAGTELAVGVHEITVSALLSDGSIMSCSFEITVEEEVLGLADNSILASLTLSPNPAVETLYLGNPENLELKSISIYDMLGRFIRLVDLKDMGIERSIDVSELTESSYFVIIQGTQNRIVKQLIIK